MFVWLTGWTALVFIKHLPFDVLEKTAFEKLLKKYAHGSKYLFILDSPIAQSGVWNNIIHNLFLSSQLYFDKVLYIPYTKLLGNTAETPTKDKLKGTIPSQNQRPPVSLPYQEAFIKQDNIIVQDCCFVDSAPSLILSPPLAPALHSSYLDDHPESPCSPFLESHAFPSSSPSSSLPSPHSPFLDSHPFPSSGPATSPDGEEAALRRVKHGREAEREREMMREREREREMKGGAFEDGVWNIVWRGYLVVLVALVLYYCLL